jgi:hypothetical protein
VVKRDHKHQISAFVWAFMFGFVCGEAEHLPGLDAATTLLPTRRSLWADFIND